MDALGGGRNSGTDACALCLDETPLERSHIIPNAFFRRIKPRGKAVQFEPDSSRPNRYEQHSWHERLLCGDCEDKLSVWERYAIGVIFEPRKHGVERQVFADLSERWAGVDYKRFRLFLISILFRASAARGDAYKNVKLQAVETEHLRSVLMVGEPLPPRIMGCVTRVLVNPHRRMKLDKFVGGPSFDTVNGNRQYVFAFGGYVWEFYAPKIPLKDYKREHYLTSEGFMTCPAISMWEHPVIGAALAISYEKEYLGQGVIRTD